MVEHQTTLVKNLHVDRLTMTEISTRYKNELNLPRCKLGSDLSPFGGGGGGGGGAGAGGYLLEQTTQRHQGSSRLPKF